jgi:hypothetical protein
MAIVLKDRVKETSVTAGTGTITLAGAVTGFQAFSAIGNGNVTYFAIVDNATGAWEVNYGTYSSGTLTRNATPLSSSNAGALVSFTSNPKDVFCTYPSEKAIYEETTGNVLIDGGPITVIGTGVTSYTTFSAALGELYGNINSFAQLYAQNLNGGSSASTDIVAYNDLGDGTNNFIDMGINSSNYSDAVYPIFTPGSGYVYNDGGELIIGSATDDVLLFAGGVATTDWAVRIDKTSKLVTTKDGLTLGGALTGVGGSFTSPVTTTSSMTSPGSTEFVTRTYVDTATSTAFVVHTACRAATTANLNTNYSNGSSGVGATLTADTNRIFTTLDGVTGWSTGQRVLIKNQTNSYENGAYTITDLGSVITPWVLTRATDFDTAGAGEIANNAYFYITAGTTNAGSSWVLAQTAAITVGTTALPFDLFSSAQVYTGGTNIDITGTVISLTGTVAPTNGGTGVNTVATGDVLYGSGTNTWSKLTIGSPYRSLVVNGAGTLPEWNAVALNQSGAVSGALPTANGGTNITTYTLGDTLYSSAANTLAKLAGNTTTTKKFLTQTGTGSASDAPAWGTISGSDVSGNISGSAGSVANALTLGTYLTGTSFNGSAAVTATVDATSANTASKVVARDASGNFSAGTITATLSGSATSATTATNVAGGAANQLVYQTGSGATSFATAPTVTSTYLYWNGSAFAWGAVASGTVTSITAGTYLTGGTITTSGTIAVDATSANTASKVVARDASGNFSAGTITASLSGNATTASSLSNALTIGTGLSGTSYNGSAAVTIANTGVTSNVAGSGISVSGATGAVTITNTGVTSNVAGTGITVSGATGAVTISIPQAITTTSSVQFGSFGVGTAASGTSGEIRATNNITAYYSSDIKFKENVRDIPAALATVNAIGGKLFDWTDTYIESKGGADGYFVQKADFGVIAQDVQKVFPIAVRTREDGSLAVDYEKLSALAFAALVELTKRVEALEAKG